MINQSHNYWSWHNIRKTVYIGVPNDSMNLIRILFLCYVYSFFQGFQTEKSYVASLGTSCFITTLQKVLNGNVISCLNTWIFLYAVNPYQPAKIFCATSDIIWYSLIKKFFSGFKSILYFSKVYNGGFVKSMQRR